MKQARTIQAAMFISVFFIFSGGASNALAEVTEAGPEYGTYPITSIPSLPQAGAKGADPSFGTSIMRLTDGSDGNAGCSIDYSYAPVFNIDSTRLMAICNYGGSQKGVFYDFDPATFTAGSSYVAQDFGFYIGGNALWSGVDEKTIYYRNGEGGGSWYGPELYAFDVEAKTNVLIKDFRSVLTAGYGLNQMSHSIDDDIWAFTMVNTSGKFVGFLVWKKSTDTVLLKQLNISPYVVDEVQIDKSGQYLTVVNASGDSQIWDLWATGGPTRTQLTWGVDGFYHYDSGHGMLLTGCNDDPIGLCYRSLSTPHDMPVILELQSHSQAQSHFSMLSDNEGWGLSANEQSNLSGPIDCTATITQPFQCELTQVATDGSGTVRRLVHHNSSAKTYERASFGNISRDGQFLAWTSDWGNASGRIDVYLAEITPAPLPLPDLIPPTVGELLTAVPDGANVNLTWTAGTDDIAVAGYRVYRDGLEIGRTATLAYSDSTALPSTTYLYSVRAYDRGGNLSPESNTLSVTTPAVLSITGVSAANIAKLSATIAWTTNMPTTGIIKYGTAANKLNSSKSDTVLADTHATNLTGLKANTRYYYTVTATESGGQTKTSVVYSFVTLRR